MIVLVKLIVTVFGCIAGIVAGLYVFLLVVDRKRQARHWDAYCETHPPISDEEFVQLCAPGVKREIALRVRAIICDCTGIDYDRIHPDTRLMQDVW